MTIVQDYHPDAILSPLDSPGVNPHCDVAVSTTERGLEMLKILNDIFDRTECDPCDE